MVMPIMPNLGCGAVHGAPPPVCGSAMGGRQANRRRTTTPIQARSPSPNAQNRSPNMQMFEPMKKGGSPDFNRQPSPEPQRLNLGSPRDVGHNLEVGRPRSPSPSQAHFQTRSHWSSRSSPRLYATAQDDAPTAASGFGALRWESPRAARSSPMLQNSEHGSLLRRGAVPIAMPVQQPSQHGGSYALPPGGVNAVTVQTLQSPCAVCRETAPPPGQDRALIFDELNLEYTFFNPVHQPLRSHLLEKLGLRPNASVDPIRGLAGSSNAGMWVVRDGNQQLMLKLVRNLPSFMGPQQPPESEKFAKLYKEHPEMVADGAISFPIKIFRCHGKGGSQTHDLIVMRKVAGTRASEYIMQKLHGGQLQELMCTLELLGGFLADFHNRYNGLQHGDLTPANVFIDQQTGKFTLVDVADIAPRNPVIQSDVDRFTSGLRLLSNFYGQLANCLSIEGRARFEAGYNARRSVHGYH